MKLIVMRHGRAETPRATLPDSERALTAQGKALISSQGIAMARGGLKPDVVFCSPYLRARQTASLLCEAFELEPLVVRSLGPGADLEAYGALVDEWAGSGCLLTVHHQPDVSGVIYALSGIHVPMGEGYAAVLDVRRIAAGGAVLAGFYEAGVMARLGGFKESGY
ncbi:MAG: histidine phosphatase family protein [Rhodothermales bacterium]